VKQTVGDDFKFLNF